MCAWGWDISWILGSFPCPASLQKPDCLSLESLSICPQHPHAHIPLSTLGLCPVWSYPGCPYCCCSSRWRPLCCVQKTMLPYRYLRPLVLVIFLPPLSRGSEPLEEGVWYGLPLYDWSLSSLLQPDQLWASLWVAIYATRSFSERDKILPRICFRIVIKVSEC